MVFSSREAKIIISRGATFAGKEGFRPPERTKRSLTEALGDSLPLLDTPVLVWPSLPAASQPRAPRDRISRLSRPRASERVRSLARPLRRMDMADLILPSAQFSPINIRQSLPIIVGSALHRAATSGAVKF